MANKKVIASCGLSNTASLNMYEVEYGINDIALVGLNNEEPEWLTINTDPLDGRAYIEWGGPYYMDEFIKL